MKTTRRREFLRTLGLSGTLAPFLPYFNRQAEAQAGAFPTRLLLVFSGNGTLEDEYWPSGGETDFTFAPGSITEPLAPFREKLLFPRGLRRLTSGSGAHEKNMGGLWTGSGLVATNGYPRSASVDQLIAQELEPDTAFPSLAFGVQCESFNRGGNKPVLKSMTYSGRNQVVTPEDNPIAMFDRLMLGDVAGGGVPVGPSPEDLEKLRAQGQSVIDAVRGDLNALHTQIDSDDRHKLEQHLEGIRELERRLTEPLGSSRVMGCISPGAPDDTFRDGETRTLNEHFPALLDIQNKLAVSALACNRTQIATLQWSRSFSGVVHEWLGVESDHHTISHKDDATSIDELYRINRWYGERFAELLTQLDGIGEGNGSLLDNTVVVWGNEAATGQHDASRMAFVMAGSASGQLRTGRLVDVDGYDWSQILVTLAHLMGATNINKVGDLDMKEGDIPLLRV